MKKIIIIVLLLFSVIALPKSNALSDINYSGETTIYKDKNSICTVQTVFDLIKNNFISEAEIRVIIHDDQYTGNGAFIGDHVITFKALEEANPENYILQQITVSVIQDLGFDYVIGDKYYINNNRILTKSGLVTSLKNLNILPSVDLIYTVTSDYFDSPDPSPFYQTVIDYSSTAGYYGTETIYIYVSDLIGVDVDVSEEATPTSSNVGVILGSIGSFLLISFGILMFIRLMKKKGGKFI